MSIPTDLQAIFPTWQHFRNWATANYDAVSRMEPGNWDAIRTFLRIVPSRRCEGCGGFLIEIPRHPEATFCSHLCRVEYIALRSKDQRAELRRLRTA